MTCQPCGYVRGPDADPSLYDAAYAVEYAKRAETPEALSLAAIRWKQVMAACPWATTVLDYGCATGSFGKHSPGPTVRNYDLNPAYGHAEEPLGTYSVVTAWDVLEHFDGDPLETLKPFLGQGSILCLSTPCVDGMRDVLASHHWKPGEHVHLFSARALLRYLERSGFEVRDVHYRESEVRKGHGPMNIVSMSAEYTREPMTAFRDYEHVEEVRV